MSSSNLEDLDLTNVDCRIGEHSTYDNDMQHIEDFVKVYHNIANEDTIHGVQTYYISNLSSYWGKFKDFINNTITEEKIISERKYKVLRTNYWEEKSNLQDFITNIVKYQKKYDQLRDKVIDNYSLENVQKAFTFISKCFCLNSGESKILFGNGKFESNYFPLTNETGFFSINSYLYGYFNDIRIIGVPNQIMSFDNYVNMCPLIFMRHDLGHSAAMEKTNLSLKRIYYEMIKNENLSKLEKEIHCFVIWILVHEIDPTFFSNPEIFYENNNFPIDMIQPRPFPNINDVARDFDDELVKYEPLIFTKKIYKQNLKIGFKYSWYKPGEKFDEVKTKYEESSIYLLICALIFSRNRIRALYL